VDFNVPFQIVYAVVVTILITGVVLLALRLSRR